MGRGRLGKVFRRHARYLGTRELRDVSAMRIYVTMDSWESRSAYEEFRERWAVEFGELDRECVGFTMRKKGLIDYKA